MNLDFRTLNADEIECRVATVNAKGASLLLYKDARCDMNILDESIGAMNWQRQHTRDNANCVVSIWDEDKSQWISKEDTGTESYTEKEKGLASDSFKRACFNWGIGRELYTAPFIWVNAKDFNLEETQYQGKKKYTTRDTFNVESISYSGKRIASVVISNAKTKKVVFTFGANQVDNCNNTDKSDKQNNVPKTESEMDKEQQQIAAQKIGQAKITVIKNELARTGVSEKAICTRYKIPKLEDITEELFPRIVSALKNTRSKEVKE